MKTLINFNQKAEEYLLTITSKAFTVLLKMKKTIPECRRLFLANFI